MTATMPSVYEEVDQTLARTWSIIAHNDDVTPMPLVVTAFVKAGLSQEDAVEKMIKIHEDGSAVIKSGMTKEDATKMYNIIKEITKDKGRLPGIDMSFVEDM